METEKYTIVYWNGKETVREVRERNKNTKSVVHIFCDEKKIKQRKRLK